MEGERERGGRVGGVMMERVMGKEGRAKGGAVGDEEKENKREEEEEEEKKSC